MQRGVMQAAVVGLVTQEGGSLRGGVQVQILVVVSHIDARRQGVVVAWGIFAVFLWAHGAVTMVTLCSRSTPVATPPLWTVCVSFDDCGYKPSIADDASVFVAVVVPFISVILQVGHTH